MQKLKEYAGFRDLQLGLTEGGGCDKALLIIRTVIEYFNKYDSTAFIVMLDISKPYDELNHCKLLFKLFSCGVLVDIIMLL